MSRKDEFEEFRTWLRYDGPTLLSDNTTNSYISNVRRVMRDAPSLDQQGLDVFFEELLSSLAGNVANYRTSWNKYADFCKERKGIDMPRPSSRKKLLSRLERNQPLVEEVRPKAPPDDVLQVIFFLMRMYRVELTDLENTTWECVRRRNPARIDLGFTVKIPGQKFSVSLTAQQRDALRSYAQPPHRTAALIPEASGGIHPYPAFWLKQWLNHAKRRGVLEIEPPSEPSEPSTPAVGVLRNASECSSVHPNVPHRGFTFDGEPLVGDDALFDQSVEGLHNRALSHLEDREQLPKFRDTSELIEYLKDRSTKPSVSMVSNDSGEVGEAFQMQFYESDGWFEFSRAD